MLRPGPGARTAGLSLAPPSVQVLTWPQICTDCTGRLPHVPTSALTRGCSQRGGLRKGCVGVCTFSVQPPLPLALAKVASGDATALCSHLVQVLREGFSLQLSDTGEWVPVKDADSRSPATTRPPATWTLTTPSSHCPAPLWS